MGRYKEDWSWKPDIQTTVSHVQKKAVKHTKKMQRVTLKKQAQRFSGNRTNSWVPLAKAVAKKKGELVTFATKRDAIDYLYDWAGAVRAPSSQNRAAPKKSASDFYASWEWKKLRFRVIKAYGPICMCCGSDNRIVVDHIKPRSKFPESELDYENMQVLCNDCNMGKSNDDFTDFRPHSNELHPNEYAELEHISDTDHLH